MREISGNPDIVAEDQLVLAARAGDQVAYGRLVELSQSSLRCFLRSLADNDPDLADDLAQDTFIIAYRQMDSFRGEGTFLSWLMGIGYRQFLQYARKKKRRRELLEDAEEFKRPNSRRDGILAIDLERALACLSLKERTAIVLNSRDGFTHEEIAAVMELPLGTVKSHISRGRDKLKHILSGQENSNG